MVDLTYLRKKRVRKVVTLVGLISLAGAVVIGAVAALGQHAAPMTVKLNNSNVSLGLTDEEGSQSYQSFLVGANAGKAKGYTEYLESGLAGSEILDSDKSNVDDEARLTGDKTSYKYYKYTFFMSNNGDADAEYDMVMNINRASSDTKEFDLTSILRVRFYENSDSQHNYETYAKPKTFRNEETGELEYAKEYISKDKSVPESEWQLAEMFADSKTIFRKENKKLAPGEKVRFTFVYWLEGWDDDSDGVKSPKVSSISLGVNISAHEG